MANPKPPPQIDEVEVEEKIDPHLVEVDNYDPGGGRRRLLRRPGAR